MFKGRVFIGILAVIVFVGIIAVFYNSMDVDYVKTGGEIVEKLESDLNLYLREKNSKEKNKIELRIEESINKVTDVAYEFFCKVLSCKVYLFSEQEFI